MVAEIAPRRRRSSLIAAYSIIFLDNFGFAVVFPIFPVLFLSQACNILPAHINPKACHLLLGFVMAAFPFAQFFGAPLFGDFGDRFGKKKALYFTIIGTVVGYALSAYAIHLLSFYLLLFGRLLTGFFAGNLSLAMAAIADLNPDRKKRGKSMSLVAALLGLSWISSIGLGAFFTNPDNQKLFNPAIPLLITAFLSLVSLWILKRYFFESSRPPSAHRFHFLGGLHNIIHVLESKGLRTYYFILFFWVLGTILALQWVAPVSMMKFGVSTTQIMWLLLASGVAWTLGSGVINPFLIQAFSMKTIYLWVLVAIALFYFLTAASDFFFYFSILYVLSAIPTSIAWSDNFSLISLAAHENEQGKAMGLAQSTTAFAEFVGPILGGIVAGISVAPLFYICALFVLVSFLLLLLTTLKKKHD